QEVPFAAGLMGDAVGGHRLIEAGPIADAAGEGVVLELLADVAAQQLDTGGEDIVLSVDGLLFFLPSPADPQVEVDGFFAGQRDERYGCAGPTGQGRK